ncbi:MAG: hypothetical protein Q8K30_00900 [Candidatus Gracilibacteria bacterium]|nr:hypothetical protein [Candidatus Gracilibacteria bacterium]
MKIIITKTFKQDFLDVFYDYRLLNIFIKKLNETKLIRLNQDLFKFKFYIKTISTRGIVFLNINNYYIPILLSKKSDKNIGDNLVLNKYIKHILDTKFEKMGQDLINIDYEIIE